MSAFQLGTRGESVKQPVSGRCPVCDARLWAVETGKCIKCERRRSAAGPDPGRRDVNGAVLGLTALIVAGLAVGAVIVF